MTASHALGLPISGGTKQAYAREIALAGGQPWDQSCVSTGDTVTTVGLERVRAAALVIAATSAKLRLTAEAFVRNRAQAAEASAGATRAEVSGSRKIKLRKFESPATTPITLATFRPSTPPERQRILLEKALVGHRATLSQLAGAFSDCKKQEDPESIDLLVHCPGRRPLLFEVKTIYGDPIQAARRALAQVYEYSYRLGRSRRAILCICFDRPLKRPEWLPDFLTRDRGINILWKSGTKFVIKGPKAKVIRSQMQ